MRNLYSRLCGDSAKTLGKVCGSPAILREQSDFADLKQVPALANSLIANFLRIDVLANNEGGIFGTGDKTVDGYAMTLQVNYLALFLLTHLLRDHFKTRKAYGDAKLANILFTRQLQRRFGDRRISVEEPRPVSWDDAFR